MSWEDEHFQKRWNLSLWKRFLVYAKPYLGQFIVLGIIMVFVGLNDAMFPFLTRIAVDHYMKPGQAADFVLFVVGYSALVVFQAALIFLLIWIAGRINQGLIYDIRQAAFAHLQKLSFSYYDKTPTGWILTRLTSDANRLGETISWGLVDLTWGVSLMLAIMGFMLALDVVLGLVTLVVVPPLVWVSLFFQKKMLFWNRQARKQGSELSAAFSEGIQGARSTKVLRRERGNELEFHYKAGRLRDSSVKVAWFSALYLPIVVTLGSLGTALAIAFGAPMVVTGTLTVGTLVAFVSYTVLFFEPVRELSRVMSELLQTQTSAERLLSLLDTPPEIVDREGAVRPDTPIEGNIEFRDLDFRYSSGPPVLTGFNLTIEAGTSVALVGETGSGKSTIVNLLCRFYEPTSGELRIDGFDYRTRTMDWLQSQLGYVLQTPLLFRMSVRENIRYGNLAASDEDVERAAKLVSAHELIVAMENGYDTDVGEGGSRLSTGQKQLISIARAVLADPRLFILDEATSSVDTQTELTIQHAVERVLRGRTSVIIAHRLSTIRNVDRILFLEHGRIVEDGNHEALMRLRGRYFDLYTHQFVREKEKEMVEAV